MARAGSSIQMARADPSKLHTDIVLTLATKWSVLTLASYQEGTCPALPVKVRERGREIGRGLRIRFAVPKPA